MRVIQAASRDINITLGAVWNFYSIENSLTKSEITSNLPIIKLMISRDMLALNNKTNNSISTY